MILIDCCWEPVLSMLNLEFVKHGLLWFSNRNLPAGEQYAPIDGENSRGEVHADHTISHALN